MNFSKTFFAFPFLFLAVLGCSSISKRVPASDPVSVPQSTAPLATAAASAQPGQEFENEFQLMFNSDQPENQLQLKLDQVEYAYFRGLNALDALDHLIDDATKKKSSPEDFDQQKISSGIGPELSALEYFSTLTKSRLTFCFNRLTQIANDSSSSDEQKKKANELLTYIGKYLNETSKATRVALNSWAEEMYSNAPDASVLKSAFDHLFVDRPELLESYLVESATQSHLLKMRKRSESPNQEIDELKKTFVRYQSDSLATDGREANSESQTAAPWSVLFEGGPHPIYTGKIMTELSQHGVPATFFLLGQHAQQNQIAASEITRRGFGVASYTQSRRDLEKLSDSEIKDDLDASTRIISEVTGQTPTLVRAPYATFTPRLAQTFKVHGLTPIIHTIDSYDWLDHNSKRVARRILKQSALTHLTHVEFRDDQSAALSSLSAFIFAAGAEAKFSPLVPDKERPNPLVENRQADWADKRSMRQ